MLLVDHQTSLGGNVVALFLRRLRFQLCNRHCNGRRRDIGYRPLKGVQLLRKRRYLLGKPFRLVLLSDELVLNDLQLVDGLLLSYLKPLCFLEKLV